MKQFDNSFIFQLYEHPHHARQKTSYGDSSGAESLEQSDTLGANASSDTREEATQITIGDLHGNAIKLLYCLVKENITKISENTYHKLVEIYKKSLDALSINDINHFDKIIDNLTFSRDKLIRLIGDELADRGSNDYFTLKLIDKIAVSRVPLEILISNHSVEFVDAYKKDSPESSKFESTILRAEHRVSFDAMNTLISKALIKKQQVLDIAERSYFSNLKCLSYSVNVNNDTITIYSHAGIDFNDIKRVAEKFGVQYFDYSIKAICKTIDNINTSFNVEVSKRGQHKLWDNDKLLYGYHTGFETGVTEEYPDVVPQTEREKCPLEFIMWNRNYEILNRRETINGYHCYYAHGHDSTESTRDRVINLDSYLGKSYLENGHYNCLFSNDLLSPFEEANTCTLNFNDDTESFNLKFSMDSQSNVRNIYINDIIDYIGPDLMKYDKLKFSKPKVQQCYIIKLLDNILPTDIDQDNHSAEDDNDKVRVVNRSNPLMSILFNPFQFESSHCKDTLSAVEQAKRLLKFFLIKFEQEPTKKIAITYSANEDQTQQIRLTQARGMFLESCQISGSNQADVFDKMINLLKSDKAYTLLKSKIHVLPVSTMLGYSNNGPNAATAIDQTHAKRDLSYIASHCEDDDYQVYVLNTELESNKPAIGGGISRKWLKDEDTGKWFIDKLMEMHNGIENVHDDIQFELNKDKLLDWITNNADAIIGKKQKQAYDKFMNQFTTAILGAKSDVDMTKVLESYAEGCPEPAEKPKPEGIPSELNKDSSESAAEKTDEEISDDNSKKTQQPEKKLTGFFTKFKQSLFSTQKQMASNTIDDTMQQDIQKMFVRSCKQHYDTLKPETTTAPEFRR